MQQPFLVGEKIYLRQIAEADLTEQYQQWFNDPDVCRFNSHHRFPNYRQDMDAYYHQVIQSKNNLILAIIDTETDKHIGNVSLQDINLVNRSAELAIVIGDKDFWGKGIAKEACLLIINHGLNALNLHRIHCETSDENISMQHVATSIGFSQEGVARSALFKHGTYHDMFQYSLINDDKA